MFRRKPTPPPPAPPSAPKAPAPPKPSGPTPGQIMKAVESQAQQIATLTARIESAGAAGPGQSNPVREIASRLEQVELIQGRLVEEVGALKRIQAEAVDSVNMLIEKIHSLLRG